ncbi:putative histidinol-phosphate aminotransferase, chloroplastic-like [Capsicum annuum]|uniref:WD repeat-containing protein 25 isoform X2 n=1 Tax=Capsicum annuum TaxID=4072 RepID=UPI001FB16264|nr:WD repeat-containing protein 25 isoform X2 [Capsicum annuum]KAF3661037.1 putative histidinol-phosphate aminotransferase, chloroplastic-like [Capsicum annuum]
MDLLCKSYGGISDEEEDENGKIQLTTTTLTYPVNSQCTQSLMSHKEDYNGGIQLQGPVLPQPKRAKFENWNPSTNSYNGGIQLQVPILPQPQRAKFENSNPSTNSQTKDSLPGRYVSKRERAAMVAVEKISEPSTMALPNRSPVLGSILDSVLPHDIFSALRDQTKVYRNMIHTPERLSIVLDGHKRSVNAVQWSTSHAHLLASAGMDQTVCIWNVWSRDQKKARVLSCHHGAVKDVKWSPYGLFVLSCGYDCTSRLIDVERGIETQVFNEDQVVGVVKFHPHNYNLFLSGGSKGHLKIWDIRAGKVVHNYLRNLDPILDAEFAVDAKRIISSSDVSKSNISENSIIVWDVSREIPLSNQVYGEAYTCPSIRCHPSDTKFIAQSNGNYIAIFSTKPPFGLDKYWRYEGHSVSGFPIKCNFSLDGEKVISGSSDGYIYVYDSKSCKIIRKIKVYDEACVDAVFHPVLSNIVASCSWSGQVSVAVT